MRVRDHDRVVKSLLFIGYSNSNFLILSFTSNGVIVYIRPDFYSYHQSWPATTIQVNNSQNECHLRGSLWANLYLMPITKMMALNEQTLVCG